MTMDFWNWLYKENPTGKYLIETAWDQEKLIGLYGIVAMKMFAGGAVFSGALSVMAATRPEYRYRGVFRSLGEDLYRRAKENGIAAVYGFPTEHSRHGFKKSLCWNYLTQGKTLINLSADNNEAGPPGLVLYNMESAGKEFDLIWRRVGRGAFRDAVMTVRDSEYINWRFFKHPEKKYFVVLAEDSLGPAGYMAVSRKADSGEVFCEVEDIVVSDVQCFRELICHARKSISENGLVRIILPMASPFYRCALGMGFRESGERFYFGWKGLERPEGLEGDWYYTIADLAGALN